MLLAAIEPMTGHGSAVDQGPEGVDAGPILNPFHELLLDRLRQNILENLHLGSLLLGDDGHFVAPIEDRSAPTGQAVGLQGQLGFEVPHEVGRLFDVVDHRQQVEVARHHRNSAKLDFAIPLGLPEDTQEDVVELRTGTEQIESLDGPAGDVDEGLGLGYVAKFSHALYKRKNSLSSLNYFARSRDEHRSKEEGPASGG